MNPQERENLGQNLARCDLFAEVNWKDVYALTLGATTVDYTVETTLWYSGTKTVTQPQAPNAPNHERSCVAYIKSGRLVMMRSGLVVGLLHQGDIIGLSGAISLVPHTATVVALAGTQLTYLDQESFQRLALQNTRLLQNAVRVLGERIGRINDMIVSLHRRLPRKEQVFNLFLQLERGEAIVESAEEMARLIDAERATVSRAITALLSEERIGRLKVGYYIRNRNSVVLKKTSSKTKLSRLKRSKKG